MTTAIKVRDQMGARMKAHEAITVTRLPRRTYTIVRLDGRAFHTYTRGLARPFDTAFAADMDAVALRLVAEVSGARFGYVQSDEISLLLTDFTTETTQAWFDGQIQKIVSISAGLASAELNRLRYRGGGPLAVFDARAFTLPDAAEVAEYFTWRQRDATRNSVSMAAQTHFSHKRLQGLSVSAMQELLFTEAGVNWNDYPAGFKRGRVQVQVTEMADVTYTRRDTQEIVTQACDRTRWVSQSAPRFGGADAWLTSAIPARPTTKDQS